MIILHELKIESPISENPPIPGFGKNAARILVASRYDFEHAVEGGGPDVN